MLFVHQVSKSYGIHTVLDRVTFSLTPGERLGLVGENGSGKTTLLRIITGQEKPDSGSVQLTPPGLRLGYLPQGLACAEDETVSGYLSAALGDTELLGERLAELAAALADSPDHSALQE
ncbi:MAG TPA: ATP-binding cassette domain-containing protein, partial [Anaerolineaceae bacterium]|nr:ATP-binding cassette domain-containing protein [Anaerolineaceae bacterium]